MPEELIILEETSELVVLAPVEAEFVIHEPPGIELLELIEKGEPGAASTIPGPQGLPGVNGDANYVHNQIAAATLWNVAHNLGKYPSVVVIDSGGSYVVMGLEYLDLNNLRLTADALFSGQAICN